MTLPESTVATIREALGMSSALCEMHPDNTNPALKSLHAVHGTSKKPCGACRGCLTAEALKLLSEPPAMGGLPEGCPKTGYWTPKYHMLESVRLDEPQIDQYPIEIHPVGTAARLAALLASQGEIVREDKK